MEPTAALKYVLEDLYIYSCWLFSFIVPDWKSDNGPLCGDVGDNTHDIWPNLLQFCGPKIFPFNSSYSVLQIMTPICNQNTEFFHVNDTEVLWKSIAYVTCYIDRVAPFKYQWNYTKTVKCPGPLKTINAFAAVGDRKSLALLFLAGIPLVEQTVT